MQKGVLDLGRALVKELGLDDSVDTLGRWMAHYIAELIEAAETCDKADRATTMSACAGIILKLWEHRHQLSERKRPFFDFEPILRAIQSLDPSNETPRYFPAVIMAAKDTEESAETKRWIDIAKEADHSAKMIIGYCLAQAAETAIDKSKRWVELATEAGIEDVVELPVLRFITAETDMLKNVNPDEEARRQVENRIKRLYAFNKMGSDLLAELRRQLKHNPG